MKNRFYPKVKTKSLTVLLVTLFLLSALVSVQFIGGASAAIDYTQYTGTLGDADFRLRIPNPWNGMLVVVCRGYSGPTNIPNPGTTLNNGGSMLEQGFAVAASNYGSAGFCIQAGVDSTYQLTMYIIDNYDVTGKVFLYGISMGGAVALLLGEKYPDLYSGVLDQFGTKDLKAQHSTKSRWANLTDEELAAELTALGIAVPPPGYTSLEALRNRVAPDVADFVLETGGTPATHPQAYEDRSPTYHANIMIPVITTHGTDDPIVPLFESLMYQTAVAKAGHSSLYRLYTVPGAGHGTTGFPSTEIPARFNELVEWSNELTGSSDWPMFCYDAQRIGYSTSNAPTTNQTLWTNMVGGGAGSHPAVADGKVYVAGWDGSLYCFDAASGAQIWNYTTGDILLTHPAVADGRVYVGSMDRKFYCLDAATGAFIWSYTTSSGIYGSPVVANGVAYAVNMGGVVYAFSAWEPIPEGLTLGVMLLLSTMAVIVGARYFRKRPKWENW